MHAARRPMRGLGTEVHQRPLRDPRAAAVQLSDGEDGSRRDLHRPRRMTDAPSFAFSAPPGPINSSRPCDQPVPVRDQALRMPDSARPWWPFSPPPRVFAAPPCVFATSPCMFSPSPRVTHASLVAVPRAPVHDQNGLATHLGLGVTFRAMPAKTKVSKPGSPLDPALRARLLDLAGTFPWAALDGATTTVVALLEKDAPSFGKKALPAGYAAAIDAQHSVAQNRSEVRGALAGERTVAGASLLDTIELGKAYLHDVRELGTDAFDNEQRFDAEKLALFKKGHGNLGKDPQLVRDAVVEAMRRVDTAKSELEALNDGEDLSTRGDALLVLLKQSVANRAGKQAEVAPEVVAFQLEKGRLAAMLKRASRAGVRQFRKADPEHAKDYAMVKLGLAAPGGKRAPKKPVAMPEAVAKP